jgi:hypothetical protein
MAYRKHAKVMASENDELHQAITALGKKLLQAEPSDGPLSERRVL